MTATEQDLYVYAVGNDPVSPDGNQYEVSFNTWFSLWIYISMLCEDILTDHDVSSGFYFRELRSMITEENAIIMAKRILDVVKSGEADKMAKKLFAQDPNRFTSKDLEKFGLFCGFSGGFTLN
jgi:hypothetical protein